MTLTSSDKLKSGLRYSFEANKALMQDLSKNGDDFVSDLKRICLSVSIDTISAMLSKRIPYAISKELHMNDVDALSRTQSAEERIINRESVELAGIALALKGCLDNGSVAKPSSLSGTRSDKVSDSTFGDGSLSSTRTMTTDGGFPTGRRKKRIMSADIRITRPVGSEAPPRPRPIEAIIPEPEPERTNGSTVAELERRLENIRASPEQP